MMRALAYAKVNLSLRVGRRRSDGYHPLHSIFQSVSFTDRLELDHSVHDGIVGVDGAPVPDDERNLAWQAVLAVRRAVGATAPVQVRLEKQIPAAAGLGGGSADAAAALHLARLFYGAPAELVHELAPTLGSDVPFCVTGGTALVQGRGDVVDPLEPIGGYALAVVVPPVELSTPEVFRVWDDLGGPEGPRLAESALPPQLRDHSPVRNDLYPAAVAVAPELEGWRADLAERWGRVVTMSGSGAALMAFFVDLDEATSAADAVPPGVRAAVATEPVPMGWALDAEESGSGPSGPARTRSTGGYTPGRTPPWGVV
jgi:4-diphosphocytidyl-2-C-methyl-D-erythritol kinase